MHIRKTWSSSHRAHLGAVIILIRNPAAAMLSAETKALSRSMKACHPASGGGGAADGFPRWRHPQRPRHSDEAGEQTRSVPLAGLAVKVATASI
jgi:hypothetical protein